jgi:hypothetical protein
MQSGGPLYDDPRLIHVVVARLLESGFAEDDIAWSESCGEPESDEAFALETIFVICNSGMHNKVARQIFEKCRDALLGGGSAGDVFGHKGKSEAMDLVWRDRTALREGYVQAEDKVAYCRSIPWIGGITSYHLAKNFGAQVAKPDVHLQRLADRHSTTCQELCETLAERTGFKVATIDLILWRACAERILDGRTGDLRREPEERAPRPRAHQHELFEPVQQELF